MTTSSLLDHCDPAYQVRFFDRLGRTMPSPPKISEIKWERKLDGISRASLNYVISGDNCCEELGSLEPLAHRMGIYRSGEMVWYGWLEDIEYLPGEVHVPAFDALGWGEKRIVRNDLSWTNNDLATIFVDIWNNSVVLPDPIDASLIVFATNTTQSREYLASEFRYAWDMIKDVLESGLNATAVGQKILVGKIPTTKPIQLKLSDFQGDVILTKKGSQFADRVIVDANEQIQGIYPPGPPAGNSLYPLVEVVIRDAQIQDQASADSAAKARYEYSRYVPRIITTDDSIILHPNVDVKINDLIPGVRVIVDTEGLCYSTKQEFRLGGVEVTVAAGEEKIAINTQPVGVRGDLADVADPL